MKLGKRRVAVVWVAALGTVALPAALRTASAVTPPVVTLTQLTHDSGVDAGEGWIGTDPRTGRIVLDWLATSDASTAAGGDPNAASPLNLTRGYCGVAAENKPGDPTSWSLNQLPFAEVTQTTGEPTAVGPTRGVHSDNRNLPICGDPVLGVGPDGTVYAAAAIIGSPTVEQGLTSPAPSDAVSWNNPTEIFGPNQTAAGAVAHAGDSKRIPIGAGRAYLAVDPNTGVVAVVSQEDGGVEGRWLVVSADRGATWSTPRPLDPDVQSSTAGAEGAANGVIAVAYTNDQSSLPYMTSPVPAVTCPTGQTSCTVFETTKETDAANGWSRHLMPGPAAASTYVAADPTTPGHFAVLKTMNSGSSIEVWVTDDSGATWTKTQAVSAPANDKLIKSAISYSESGALGLVYRLEYASTSFDVFARVSTEGGVSWSDPITLTTNGPTAPNTGMSDDCACNVDVDATHLSAVWGDDRTAAGMIGPRQLWFATFDYTKVAVNPQ